MPTMRPVTAATAGARVRENQRDADPTTAPIVCGELRQREREVRGEFVGPEDVHVGPLLEDHVLDARAEEQPERVRLFVPAEEEDAKKADRGCDLPDGDGERREAEVDPCLARVQRRSKRRRVGAASR